MNCVALLVPDFPLRLKVVNIYKFLNDWPTPELPATIWNMLILRAGS